MAKWSHRAKRICPVEIFTARRRPHRTRIKICRLSSRSGHRRWPFEMSAQSVSRKPHPQKAWHTSCTKFRRKGIYGEESNTHKIFAGDSGLCRSHKPATDSTSPDYFPDATAWVSLEGASFQSSAAFGHHDRLAKRPRRGIARPDQSSRPDLTPAPGVIGGSRRRSFRLFPFLPGLLFAINRPDRWPKSRHCPVRLFGSQTLTARAGRRRTLDQFGTNSTFSKPN